MILPVKEREREIVANQVYFTVINVKDEEQLVPRLVILPVSKAGNGLGTRLQLGDVDLLFFLEVVSP